MERMRRRNGTLRARRSRLLLATLISVTVSTPLALLPEGAPGAPHRATAATGPCISQPSTAPGAPPVASLADLVEPLPIVVRELPDPDALAGVRAYDEATLLQPSGAATLFSSSFRSLAALAPEAGLLDLAARLESDEPVYEDPDARAEVQARLAPLTRDPKAADRLNNAAVGLFFLGLANTQDRRIAGDPPPPEPGGFDPIRGLGVVRELNAIALIEIGREIFPRSRALAVNVAVLGSLRPDVVVAERVLRGLRALHAADPADLTARLVLGELTARRRDVPDALEQALGILRPLAEDAGTSELGEAAMGDAYLAQALLHAGRAPFRARSLARLALEAYGRAGNGRRDPELEGARASALEVLGDAEAARGAQRAAVDLAPASAEAWLELATQHESAGDAERMREAGCAALSLVHAEWDPPLRRLRLVTHAEDYPELAQPRGPFGIADHGLLGLSVGRARPRVTVTWERGFGGGAYVVDPELVPRVPGPPSGTIRRTLESGRAAAEAVIAADLLLGQPKLARRDVTPWLDAAGSPRPPGPEQVAGIALVAASIAADEPLPDDVDTFAARPWAELAYRRGGRFDLAAAMCGRLAARIETPRLRLDERRCEGENAYLAGDLPRALTSLQEVVATAQGPTAVPEGTRTALAATLLALGRKDEARDALALAARDVPSSILALRFLGDLALDADDAAGAVAHYDLADAVRADEERLAGQGLDYGARDRARAVGRFVLLNRAVARLRLAQQRHGEASPCGAEGRGLCREARADAEAAVAADPEHAVAHMNLAWASRSLGEDRSAREALRRAADLDPGLFPALNDLGVLAARAGDVTEAVEAFEAARAGRPDYALPAWNLGVLGMARGGASVVEGQTRLAEAVALEPSFRTDPLAYKTDERVYRVTFRGAGTPTRIGTTPGVGFSVAAAGMGAIAVAGALSALAQFQAGAAASVAASAAALAEEPLPHRLRRAWRRVRRRWRRQVPPRVRAGIPWLATVPLLVLATVASALPSSPDGGASLAVLAVVGALLALVAHELGHVIAARRTGARLHPAQWTPGLAATLLLLPVQVAPGPFFGERYRPGDRRRAALVAWAGPLANLLAAGLLVVLSVVTSVPAFRLWAQIQLAAAAYTLLPNRPLDGWVVKHRGAAPLALVALVVTLLALALTLGLV